MTGKVSRRTILGGLSAASLSSSATPSSSAQGVSASEASAAFIDPVAERCLRWVRSQSDINNLQLEWARIEHHLSELHPNFFQLRDADRIQLEGGGARMAEIDARIETLYEFRNRELPSLPVLRSTSISAVLAKLAVVRELLYPDEFPEGHRLVSDSIDDLIRLWPERGPSGDS